MTVTNTIFAAFAAALFCSPGFAGDIEINDSYARAASPSARAGAAFMVISNTGADDDRLIGVTSDVARKVELHTHIEISDGVMQMVHVEEGIIVPAMGEHVLERGGDHVMFMGLTRSLEPGDMVEIVLTFETAGEISIEVPVDLDR